MFQKIKEYLICILGIIFSLLGGVITVGIFTLSKYIPTQPKNSLDAFLIIGPLALFLVAGVVGFVLLAAGILCFWFLFAKKNK